MYYWFTNHSALWFVPILLVLGACASDAPIVPEQVPLPIAGSRAIYIANEGNFQWGNASISVYYPDAGLTQADWFTHHNQRPIGDVLQSLSIIDGKLWAVLNNSGKIEVVDPHSGKSFRTIENFNSPRYLLPVGNDVLVSDLYDKSISVVNAQTFTITKRIAMPSWTEEMELVNNRIFVCMPHHRYLYVLKTDLVIEDSIYIGIGTHASVVDDEGMLWIAAAGDIERAEAAALFKINPNTLSVVNTVPLPNSTGLSARLGANANADTLWLLHQDVYRLVPKELNAQPSLMLEGKGKNYYGIGIDPYNGDIYVADAGDFVSKGKVLIYDADVNFKHELSVGFIPSAFLFE